MPSAGRITWRNSKNHSQYWSAHSHIDQRVGVPLIQCLKKSAGKPFLLFQPSVSHNECHLDYWEMYQSRGSESDQWWYLCSTKDLLWLFSWRLLVIAFLLEAAKLLSPHQLSMTYDISLCKCISKCDWMFLKYPAVFTGAYDEALLVVFGIRVGYTSTAECSLILNRTQGGSPLYRASIEILLDFLIMWNFE